MPTSMPTTGSSNRNHQRQAPAAACAQLVVVVVLDLRVIVGGLSLIPRTHLSRGAIVNRTNGTHKNLPGIHLTIFTNNIWSY